MNSNDQREEHSEEGDIRRCQFCPERGYVFIGDESEVFQHWFVCHPGEMAKERLSVRQDLIERFGSIQAANKALYEITDPRERLQLLTKLIVAVVPT